jgi:hypothetical protein
MGSAHSWPKGKTGAGGKACDGPCSTCESAAEGALARQLTLDELVAAAEG